MIGKKNKEISSPKKPSQVEVAVQPKTRVLTAEGWKRAELRKRGKMVKKTI